MVLSLPVPGFSWHFVFVITHHGVVSEPVPAVVVMHMIGKAGSGPCKVGVRASGKVVEDGPPALGGQERDRLGRIHGAPAAEPDSEIASVFQKHLCLAVDVHVLRVGVDVV